MNGNEVVVRGNQGISLSTIRKLDNEVGGVGNLFSKVSELNSVGMLEEVLNAHKNKMSGTASDKSKGYKAAFKTAVKKVIISNNKENFWRQNADNYVEEEDNKENDLRNEYRRNSDDFDVDLEDDYDDEMSLISKFVNSTPLFVVDSKPIKV
jgi:hypothetical protein